MANKITCFEDLVIWQKAQEIAEKVYKLADSNSFIQKDLSLKNQLKSASLSISDNIAEGFDYNNNPDFYKFLRIAEGSYGETRNKLLFIKRMEYIDESTAKKLSEETNILGRQIGELMKKVKNRIQSEKNSRKKNGNP
mgnify:CR=1 FL=1